MANYECHTRTNYFHVKDVEQFKELMAHTYGSDGVVELWEKTDDEDNPIFAFGCSGAVSIVKNTHSGDIKAEYDEFIDALQGCVEDGDAIIIMQSGHDELKYLTGLALVITHDTYEELSISEIACEKAAEMLENPDWDTECEY